MPVTATPDTMAGIDSGRRTLKMILAVGSTHCLGRLNRTLVHILKRDDTHIRAKNGVLAKISGGRAALAPSIVPTSARVSGISRINRIKTESPAAR